MQCNGKGRENRRSGASVAQVGENTMHSESHCARRLRYIDLVVSIEVAVKVCLMS
jgi:hypothetical protein